MNAVQLSGRIGAEPEVMTAKSGVSVTKLSLAVDGWSSATKERKTNWFRVIAFGKVAEFIRDNFAKGSAIAIVGSLDVASWEKDGQRQTRVEIIADKAEFWGPKAQGEQRAASAPPAQQPDVKAPGDSDDWGSVPF